MPTSSTHHPSSNHRLIRRLAGAALPWLAAASVAAQAQPPLRRLPALGLRADAVTVSGLSSGGYMAGQFAVAHSASVAGVAVLAAGPYGCSRGSVGTAMLNCSCPAEQPFALKLQALWSGGCQTFDPAVYGVFADAATHGNESGIDDAASHLRRQRVWLFSGGADPVVEPPLVQAVQDYYRRWGAPAAQIRHETRADAGHGFPSPQARQGCDATRTPFLNDCGLDAAGELLKWLNPDWRAPSAPGQARAGSLKRFSQAGYRRERIFDGLDDTGWVYVPAACEQSGTACRLHVAFHGCEQGQSFAAGGRKYGKQFVEGAGYNRWAEAGGIVVLYPQIKASAQGNLFDPHRFNPKGCWDFWGYTERSAALKPHAPDFAKRSAPQVRAVKAMVDDLLRAR